MAPSVDERRPSARELRAARQDLDELRADMRSRDAGDRKRAVRKAAQIGGPDALAFVLDALGDERGQVADTAESMLVEHFAESAPEALQGAAGLGSKDTWRRVRAIETLAALGAAPDAKLLAKALDRREPRVAWTALVGIERIAAQEAGAAWDDSERKRLVKKVRPLLKRSAGDELQARALLALDALDPDEARALGAHASSGPRMRAAALGLALGRGDGAGLDALAAAVADDDPGMRAFALERVVDGSADRAVLSAVVERLDAEPRPCVRERAVRALRAATGLGHGANARAWGAAVAALPDDWAPAAPEEAASKGEGGSQGAVALGGLDPKSDRVAVLVDFSGSLWRVGKGGKRKKDALDPEVTAFLGRLAEDARFVVVPFTQDLHPLSDGPVDASRRTVERACADFVACRHSGRGDAFRALEYALEVEEIDRIVLVTDGSPTGGRRWEIDRIVDLLLERTRLRPVTFDVLLDGASKGIVRRWRRLPGSTGGRTVAVDAPR